MTPTRTRHVLRVAALALCAAALPPSAAWAQTPTSAAPTTLTVEQPDAQRAKDELSALLEHYPPSLYAAFWRSTRVSSAMSPILRHTPGLVSFLSAHPEIARNPSFYVGEGALPRAHQDPASQILDMWRDVLNGLSIFAGFGMAVGVLVWLIRTLVFGAREKFPYFARQE